MKIKFKIVKGFQLRESPPRDTLIQVGLVLDEDGGVCVTLDGSRAVTISRSLKVFTSLLPPHLVEVNNGRTRLQVILK